MNVLYAAQEGIKFGGKTMVVFIALGLIVLLIIAKSGDK